MKTAQDIIIAPVITEKSMSGIADKKYTFTAAWKKAIVTLKADSKPIEFFDGLI